MAGGLCWREEENLLPVRKVSEDRKVYNHGGSPEVVSNGDSVNGNPLTRTGSNVSQITSYHQDRSVTEIETDFSEHFLPVDAISTSSSSEQFPSSEFHFPPDPRTPRTSSTFPRFQDAAYSPSSSSSFKKDNCNSPANSDKSGKTDQSSRRRRDSDRTMCNNSKLGAGESICGTPASNTTLHNALSGPSALICGSNASPSRKIVSTTKIPPALVKHIKSPNSAMNLSDLERNTSENEEESRSTTFNNEIEFPNVHWKPRVIPPQFSLETEDGCFTIGSKDDVISEPEAQNFNLVSIGSSDHSIARQGMAPFIESDLDSSLHYDSAIQSEAQTFARTILEDMKICDDNGDSIDDKSDILDSKRNSDIFIESTSEDAVTIDNFAFSNQTNYFQSHPCLQLPPDLKHTEDAEESEEECENNDDQSYKNQQFLHCTKVPKELSLIEEVTEHSSLSTIRSNEVCDTPRNPLQDISYIEDKIEDNQTSSNNQSNQLTCLESVPLRNMQPNQRQQISSNANQQFKSKNVSHIPRILDPLSPRDSSRISPRTKSDIGMTVKPTRLIHQVLKLNGGKSCEGTSALPSKSNPSTPRLEEYSALTPRTARHDSLRNPTLGQFTQNKPKIVAKRFIRSSPPREGTRKSEASRGVSTPIQTKTGLTVTVPQKETETEPFRQQMSRSNSSASLTLRNKGRSTPTETEGALDRKKSLSSGSLVTRGLSHKRPRFDHVESKVAQYIREVKNITTPQRPKGPDKVLSRSCSNLSRVSSLSLASAPIRPKTAETVTTKDTKARIIGEMESCSNSTVSRASRLDLRLKKSKSKSETNLTASDLLGSLPQVSKSTLSLAFGNIDKLVDCSDPEDPGEEVTIHPGDLVDLVIKERQGKQEAKKVLTELQANYDQLLQKFAAAENALDKVRFGALPPPDSGAREEAFNLAVVVAEKIASFEVGERRDRQGPGLDKWLDQLRVRRADLRFKTEKIDEEKTCSVLSAEQILDIKQQGANILSKAASLEMAVSHGTLDPNEAGAGLGALTDSLREMINHQADAGNNDTVLLLSDVTERLEGIQARLLHPKEDKQVEHPPASLQSPVLQAAIAKVSLWQKSLPNCPPPPTGLPSCYGSLPTSPTPSQDPVLTHQSSVHSPDPQPGPPVRAIPQKMAPLSLGTHDLDSGCPGSDRSTLWLSGGALQSRGLSPSSKSKSRENISSTPLYNLEEEHLEPSENLALSPKSSQDQWTHQDTVICHPRVRTPRDIMTPRDVVSCNNQFVTSVTIERGIRLTPRAEAEQRNRTNSEKKYREIFRKCREEKEACSNSPQSGRGSLNFQGLVTSTPKQRVRGKQPNDRMVRSSGMRNLRALAEGDMMGIEPRYVTDLSSDEEQQVVQEQTISQAQDQSDAEYMEQLQFMNILPDNYHMVEQELQRTRLLATPKKTPKRCLFQGKNVPQTKGGLEQEVHIEGPHSQILAEEIDNEILELRNFFEDHREEMMSLLHGGGDEMPGPQNISLPLNQKKIPHVDGNFLKKATSLGQIRKGSDQDGNIESLEDPRLTPDLPDPQDLPPYMLETQQHERRFQSQEAHLNDSDLFSDGRLNYSLPNCRATYESESDVAPDKILHLRKQEFEKRRLKKEDRRRRINGRGGSDVNSSRSPKDQTSISSFFPLSSFQEQMESHVKSPNNSLFSMPALDISSSHLTAEPPIFKKGAWTETDNESLSSRRLPQNAATMGNISFLPSGTESNRCREPNIPKLNLEDICSDVTALSQSLDYSFSHSPHKRMSLDNPLDIFQLGHQGYRENQVLSSERDTCRDQGRSSHRSVGCDTQDLVKRALRQQANNRLPTSTQTTPGRCNTSHLPPSPLGKSLTMLQEPETTLSSQACSVERILQCARGPVIINQTNCDHKCVQEKGEACKKKTGEAKKRKSSKKKAKSSKDLSELLDSLDAANSLALRLKKRFEEMLGLLGQEMSHIQEKKSFQ